MLHLKGLVFHGGPFSWAARPAGALQQVPAPGLAWGAGLLSLFGIKLQ